MPNPQFNCELQSGDFGPHTRHYHIFREAYGQMIRPNPQPHPTRQAARRSVGNLIGHVATVGYPANHCPICPKPPSE